MSHVDEFGRDVHEVHGPFGVQAARPASLDHGGTLDRGIVARLEGGRSVVVGEIWALGPASDGARISLDSIGFARRIVDALNAESAQIGEYMFASDYVVWSWQHAMWWGPDHCGYTPHLERAGRYTAAEAGAIVTNSIMVEEIAINVSVAAQRGAPTHAPWGGAHA